ncbi:MAG: dihydrofolate reductase [Proteobacteria bacterium]|nr:dihydrofolate reductase [Pseudomonadota bacterium]
MVNSAEIVLIAAIGKNRELGYQNKLIWQIPGDLPRFKQITMGSPIIMGRKTFDSIGHPLPGRQNIVITRNKGWSHIGVDSAYSSNQALALAAEAEKIFVIGGSEVYDLYIELADRLELTEVDDAPPQVDVWFPDYKEYGFVEKSREDHLDTSPSFAYVSYIRT